jgi:transposase InsO family protein
MGDQLTLNAIARAFKNRETEPLQGLIHHSDQGVQYVSKEYVCWLLKRAWHIDQHVEKRKSIR